MGPLLRTGPRVACGTCAVTYDNSLTLGQCPVCGTASGVDSGGRAPLDRDQRLIAVVGVTMIANLLILGGLALLYLQL